MVAAATRLLSASDVLGRRIELVWSRFEVVDGWLDSGRGWLTLDNSISVSLPLGDATEWWSELVPSSARLAQSISFALSVERAGLFRAISWWWTPQANEDRVVGARIAAVHRPLFEGAPDSSESVIVELDDRRSLSFVSVAPQGVNHAGLLLHEPSFLDVLKEEGTLPFWDGPAS